MKSDTSKNNIKARLKIIQNLAEVIDSLAESIFEELAFSEEDDLKDVIVKNIGNANETIKYISENGYFENAHLKEGAPEIIPTLEVFGTICNLSVPVGGKRLTLYNCDWNGTPQVGIAYDYNHKTTAPIELVTVEVKRGELAETHGLPENNMDVDIYLYENPYDDDYTQEARVSYNDIRNVMQED